MPIIEKDSGEKTETQWIETVVVGLAKNARDTNRTRVEPQVHWNNMPAHVPHGYLRLLIILILSIFFILIAYFTMCTVAKLHKKSKKVSIRRFESG